MSNQKITYKQWKAILLRVAKNAGYIPRVISAGFDDTWFPLYKKGMTPKQAWESV